MASHQGTVDFIVEQSALAGTVSTRKMFGEYGIHCDGKMVALVCDDRLFVKPTPDGHAFLGACEQAPPYPSAKPHLVVAGERWDDREWLSTLIRITAAQLPMPVKRGR
ncbi:TfoX/Sxy family protein [Burkholderia vietnamiensis]|uniref:TfoX/Sxy family protein n=1 Tax=Burkholderia vietnamiensis TaxID=60552 RepID=UPI001B9DE133|nr:TfoX/Sxy family protein [Burkholderia vietnamiensis]MBR8033735.1 TfoX/Sxy family protein [Burkholderia vietnamiensis]